MIMPVEESVHSGVMLLGNSEELLERIKEIKEHKVLVKANLHVSWKLLEKNQVLLNDESLVVVMRPFVLKMGLDTLF